VSLPRGKAPLRRQIALLFPAADTLTGEDLRSLAAP
jgi:hypothetical protein